MKLLNDILSYWFVICLVILSGCTKEDILTSYEEEKTSELQPLSFTPYLASAQESEATTRADVNYLIYGNTLEGNPANYDKLPVLGEKRNPSVAVASDALNNYIVGVFGYNYNGTSDTWNSIITNDAKRATVTPNFMINQPLRHTATSTWEYAPLKYWPNNTTTNSYSTQTDKVTFVSYYPFQDYQSMGRDASASTPGYYRDGKNTSGVDDSSYANLTNIVPPAKGATGVDAYTFTFTQKEKVEEHIDFLMGINVDQVKTSSPITLNLKHTLNAMQFGIKVDDASKGLLVNTMTADGVDEYRFEVNSITLKDLVNSGKVYCDASGNIKWSLLDDPTNYPRKDYILNFKDAANLDYQPYYERYKEGGSYKTRSNAIPEWRKLIQKDVKGPRFIILFIPQSLLGKVLELNYNLKYTYRDDNDVPHTVNYENQTESLTLSNDATNYQNNTGKRVSINLLFHVNGIEMEATVGNWVDVDVEEIEPDDSNNQTP